MNNDNKNEFSLLDEIGNIDEDMLQSAKNYKKSKKAFPFKKALSIAAALTVAIGIGFCIKFTNQNPDRIMSEITANSSEDKSSTVENESAYSGSFSEDSEKSSITSEDALINESSQEKSEEEAPASFDESEENSESVGVSSEAPTQSEETSEEEVSENVHESIPPLDSCVVIDDLNKLAYYSGWKMLREYGVHTQKLLSAVPQKNELKPLSNEKNSFSNVSALYDLPDNIIAYAVQDITVSDVEYFQVEIKEKCFITNQVLTGTIEVMILNVSFDNVVSETMIVFKNEKDYFSCLLDTYSKNEKGDRIYIFKPTRVVQDFNIVNEPELSGYSFTVTFVNTDDIPQINFSYKEYGKEGTYTLYVSEHTYNTAKNVTVSNSVASLNDALYKIYVEEVASGTNPSELPEKPQTPEIPQLPATQHGEEIRPEILTYEKMAEFKEVFGTESGYAIVNKGTEGYDLLKKAYNNDELEELLTYMDYYPEGSTFIVAWVKGVASFSKEKFYLDDKTLVGNLEYVVFSESPRYTIKLYSFIYEVEEIEKITFKQVEYSVSATTSFTTINEHDSLGMFGIENEDEFQINLLLNGRYELYKNNDKIYESQYQISQGFISFNTDEGKIYTEIYPDNTFVLELEGWKRVFSLM